MASISQPEIIVTRKNCIAWSYFTYCVTGIVNVLFHEMKVQLINFVQGVG